MYYLTNYMKERNISLNLQIKIKNFIEYSH